MTQTAEELFCSIKKEKIFGYISYESCSPNGHYIEIISSPYKAWIKRSEEPVKQKSGIESRILLMSISKSNQNLAWMGKDAKQEDKKYFDPVNDRETLEFMRKIFHVFDTNHFTKKNLEKYSKK